MSYTGTITKTVGAIDAKGRRPTPVEFDDEGNPTAYLWGEDKVPALPLKEELADYTFRGGICINFDNRRYREK